MTSRLTVDIDEAIALVRLNRPEKYNALDIPTFEGISEVCSELAANTALRVVVLTGAGDNFCAGIDTANFVAAGGPASPDRMAPQANDMANFFQRAATAWADLPIPVVAALRGTVFGGGLQVAMGADIRVAEPAAKFSVMEIKWGLIPDMGLSRTCRDLVRLDVLRELTYSGRIFSADEARDFGFVTSIHDDPLTEAMTIARRIAAQSPDAVRAAKRLLGSMFDQPVAESLRTEANIQLGIIGKPNQLEAVTANLQKREPVFQ